MPAESDDDRAAFFSPDEFGVEVTYTPSAGADVAVTGIYDGPTTFADIGERAMVQTSRVTFCCQRGDLPAAAGGGSVDTLSLDHPVSGETLSFSVITIEPDGAGLALLTLGKA